MAVAVQIDLRGGTLEQYDRFAQQKIGPLTLEVGMPNPPEIQLFEVHNYLTSG